MKALRGVTGGRNEAGGAASRGALAWVVSAVAAYAVVFVLLTPVLGVPVMALLFVPVALGGWLFGALGGGVVGLVLVVLNAALSLTSGRPNVAAAAAFPGVIPGGLVVLACGVSVGLFRQRQALLLEMRQQLQEQLRESEGLAAALGASEQRFRLLSEEALFGVYLINDDVFKYVNPALAKAFGYEAVEIIERMSPDDLTVPEDREGVRGHIEARQMGEAPSAWRFRGLRKDGSRFPVEVKGRELQLGGRSAILGTLQDRTREAAYEAELRLRLMALEAAPAGIVVTNPKAIIEWANPEALALSGYALHELVGQHTRIFQSGRQSNEFYKTLWETVTSGRPWSGDLVNRRKDGSEYFEHMKVTPVLDAGGAVEHLVAVKQDVTKRRAAERSIRELNASLKVQLERVMALRAVEDVITRGLELPAAVAEFVDIAQAALGVDALSMQLYHADTDMLEVLELRGLRGPVEPGAMFPAATTLVGQAMREGRTQLLRGSDEIVRHGPVQERLLSEGFEVIGAAPMMARGQLRGGLHFAHRGPHPTTSAWLGFLEALATQGAILIDNITLLGDLKLSNEDLRAAYDATIEGWSRALDLRDKETEGHSQRVTELTMSLGRAMGLDEEQLVQARRGALLHDIGKMGVPDGILQKPGKLSEEEWQLMRRHTTFARDLLAPVAFLAPALDIPYAHHERWDGSGYPEGLKGENIPLLARIFAVADVYDAVTSDRPYRKAWTRVQALKHIRDGAGSHFDPRVVAAFQAMQTGPTPPKVDPA